MQLRQVDYKMFGVISLLITGVLMYLFPTINFYYCFILLYLSVYFLFTRILGGPKAKHRRKKKKNNL